MLVFEWVFENNQFTCDVIEKYKSSVADIHGMQVFTNTSLNVIIYGKGIEILQLD